MQELLILGGVWLVIGLGVALVIGRSFKWAQKEEPELTDDEFEYAMGD